MKDNLTLLQNEKNETRKELLVLLQIQYLSMFSFLALIGAVISTIAAKTTHWYLVMFVFSQIEFTMLMFNISLLSNIYMLGGYIRTLENKINEIVGEPVTIWESRISYAYYQKHKHGFTIGHIIVWLSFFALFILLSCCSFIAEKNDLTIFSVTLNKVVVLGFQIFELGLILIAFWIVKKVPQKTAALSASLMVKSS